MEWFRMYHDVIHDPKIQRLTVDLRWRWVELLCIASKADDRGNLPSVEDCAYLMRLSTARAAQVIDALIENGLIDRSDKDQTLAIHGWEARQKPSDSSKKRVEEWRKRHKQEPDTKAGNILLTLQKQDPRARAQDSETEEKRGAPNPISDTEEDTGGLEPFHTPPVIASPAFPGGRSGHDLESWNAAIDALRSKAATEPLAGSMETHADDPDVRELEGWRFIQAGRVVGRPGNPKTWRFLLGCARNATREEFEHGQSRVDRSQPRAEPEPRRLPQAAADSPMWALSQRLDLRLDRQHAR